MKTIGVSGQLTIFVGVFGLCLLAGAPRPQAEDLPCEPQPSHPWIRPDSKLIVFQLGADAFGGGLGGMDFIGGINGSLLYPLHERFWVGIRPALHYVYPDDSEFEATWIHGDAAVQVNLLRRAPLRLYVLGTAGYALALDGDLYEGGAHGWSASGAVGLAWSIRGPLGLFAELGFRGGSTSRDQTVHVRDGQGQPVCPPSGFCPPWQTEQITRTLSLRALTVNLGLVYGP